MQDLYLLTDTQQQLYVKILNDYNSHQKLTYYLYGDVDQIKEVIYDVASLMEKSVYLDVIPRPYRNQEVIVFEDISNRKCPIRALLNPEVVSGKYFVFIVDKNAPEVALQRKNTIYSDEIDLVYNCFQIMSLHKNTLKRINY